jgi:hypothetical protein
MSKDRDGNDVGYFKALHLTLAEERKETKTNASVELTLRPRFEGGVAVLAYSKGLRTACGLMSLKRKDV